MSGGSSGLARGLVTTLVAMAAVLALGRSVLRPDPEVRNREVFPDMVRGPAVESMGLAAPFDDGLVQRPLVPGVVPRGTPYFPYGPGDEEAERAGRELVNPLKPDDASAPSRGARLYAIHCVVCHDGKGEGQGAAVLRGMLAPPPFKGERVKAMKDGQVFHAITMGRGNMAPYAAALEPGDRWAVVLHVRSLRGPGGGK